MCDLAAVQRRKMAYTDPELAIRMEVFHRTIDKALDTTRMEFTPLNALRSVPWVSREQVE